MINAKEAKQATDNSLHVLHRSLLIAIDQLVKRAANAGFYYAALDSAQSRLIRESAEVLIYILSLGYEVKSNKAPHAEPNSFIIC